MKILHIASQYNGSKVYERLTNSIDNIAGNYQYIYIPTRKEIDKKENKGNISYYDNVTYNSIDRILYYSRLIKTSSSIEKDIEIKKMDVIHAHTLFADGGVAYRLNKKYHVPYIVAIRSTDVREYIKKMPHAKLYMNKILKNASKIVFISPSLKKELGEHLDNNTKEMVENKTVILPNGIDNYWHDNYNIAKEYIKKRNEINFIQVSELDLNKNLYASIDVIKCLNQNGISAKLTVIGTGREEERYKDYVKESNMEKNILFVGYIKEKEKLKELYRKNDIFIMLSKRETFGLVYIEAMSQGLPIIYTRGTGIDKYFNDGEVGYSLSIDKTNEIMQVIPKILKNYKEMSFRCVEQSKNFKWHDIAEKYEKIYKEIK